VTNPRVQAFFFRDQSQPSAKNKLIIRRQFFKDIK
jgi:hypothetical protein